MPEPPATYLEFQLPAATHGCVFERLDDAHVRILQGGVFTDENDLNSLVETLGAKKSKVNQYIIVFLAAKTYPDVMAVHLVNKFLPLSMPRCPTSISPSFNRLVKNEINPCSRINSGT
jgi:hypothetical protein